jgi:hypothetical protein
MGTLYTTDYLAEINNLLASPVLDINAMKTIYHTILLDNAQYTIQTCIPHQFYKYVEEFIANAIYLLELENENDARTQLQAVQEILGHNR